MSRAAHYRRLDVELAAAKAGAPFKAFEEMLYGRPEVLGIWIACTLPSLPDDQLLIIAAKVPPLFAAVSAERARRRAMESGS